MSPYDFYYFFSLFNSEIKKRIFINKENYGWQFVSRDIVTRLALLSMRNYELTFKKMTILFHM